MPARFELCLCNLHGRIVLTDGSRGPENCFQRHAIIVARSILAHQQMLPAEAVEVMHQILASPLPRNPSDVDVPFLYTIENYNQFLMHNPVQARQWNAALIHQYLQEPVIDAIPADFVAKVSRHIASYATQLN